MSPAWGKPTPTPPKVVAPPELKEPAEVGEPEINDLPKSEDNPLLPPNLDELIDRNISQDVWEQLKDELPCVQATKECVFQLQAQALSSSRVLREMDTQIEEAQGKIDEARANNLKSINVSTLSPFLQASFGTVLTPLVVSKNTSGIVNPFSLIFGNFFANLFGDILNTIFPWQNLQSTGEAASRAIAISDLQIKVAQLQRGRTEMAQKLKETVLMEALKLEEIAREFQGHQEIARREKLRLQILQVSYRFGDGDSRAYLAELAAYDRSKIDTWRKWSRLRAQLIKLKLLVFNITEE
ncbi:MAG: hypothetical protein Cpurp_01220 [Chlorogloea purpurea SAG 13.99]|jgi:hypothetical protein|nr:hypothetical protein [Chlorogloea purpurea SAG 13.99]